METTKNISVTEQTQNDHFHMNWLTGDEWRIYERDQSKFTDDATTSNLWFYFFFRVTHTYLFMYSETCLNRTLKKTESCINQTII